MLMLVHGGERKTSVDLVPVVRVVFVPMPVLRSIAVAVKVRMAEARVVRSAACP